MWASMGSFCIFANILPVTSIFVTVCGHWYTFPVWPICSMHSSYWVGCLLCRTPILPHVPLGRDSICLYLLKRWSQFGCLFMAAGLSWPSLGNNTKSATACSDDKQVPPLQNLKASLLRGLFRREFCSLLPKLCLKISSVAEPFSNRKSTMATNIWRNVLLLSPFRLISSVSALEQGMRVPILVIARLVIGLASRGAMGCEVMVGPRRQ